MVDRLRESLGIRRSPFAPVMVPGDAVGPSLFRFEGAALSGWLLVMFFLLRLAPCVFGAGKDRSPVRAVDRGVFCHDPGVCRSAP